jgi:thiol:disulfide interchange protein DsbD
MKKISLIIWFSLLFSGLTLNAQILEPVKWAFSLNQLSETEYEIIARL